ncbi:virulence factor TspB C-terminal domain-related protein [Duganella sp. HH101]|uniref:virulence factor TspB C-terminal domain-related protein n=1 Tax=Duganella sp. HH101 TaxID=1781066 RepID=UPI000892CBA0|nr:virulence factor TspB C-terminal domain-related protein [Duganella sp. HH101]OFA02621.1 hypothetical protein DUGA2_34710 [Duganella sp. HH101]
MNFVKKLFALLSIQVYLFVSTAQALVMPPISTFVGREILSAMASRGATAGASRILSGLGPYGLLAGLLLPAAIDWIRNSDGTVTYTPPADSAPGSGGGNPSEVTFRSATYNGKQVEGSDPLTVGRAVIMYGECGTYTCSTPGVTYSNLRIGSTSPNGTGSTYTVALDSAWNGGGTTRTAVVYGYAETPPGAVIDYTVPIAAKPPKTVSVPEAMKDMPADMKEKVIPAQQMADIINKVLQDDAAVNGTKAYNDTVNNPMTAQMIEAIRAATGQVPKVGDLANPIGFPDPATVQNPLDPVIKPGEPGPIPGYDYTLPESPTVEKINVPATFIPTVFAAPTGCPAPISFTMFGKTYDLKYQSTCDLMTTLSPIFLACGAAAAALIFAQGLRS